MILQQQPQQFAPIGFQIGLDVTVRLLTGHLDAQMVRDRDELLIGAMKRLVNRDNLCFHRFGPLVEGVEWIKCFIYPLRGLFSSIIRCNMLISFNSVSLRKSHTHSAKRRCSFVTMNVPVRASVIERPPDTGAAWSETVYVRVVVPRLAVRPAGGPAENPRPVRRAHEWSCARPVDVPVALPGYPAGSRPRPRGPHSPHCRETAPDGRP